MESEGRAKELREAMYSRCRGFELEAFDVLEPVAPSFPCVRAYRRLGRDGHRPLWLFPEGFEIPCCRRKSRRAWHMLSVKEPA